MALNNLDRISDNMVHLPAAGGGGSGMAVGGPITGGTDGNILFVGAGGVLAQDAALFWDDTDNQLVLGAGTVGKPSLIFGDDTTGLYAPAANQIGIALSGVAAMRLGATGPDSDQIFTVGRVLIDSRLTDRAVYSHRDMAATTQYAISQAATGNTTVNSSTGVGLGLAVGATIKWTVDGTTFNLVPGTDNAFDFGTVTSRIRRLYMAEYWEGSEIADPAAPGADKGRLYFKDSGGGKTQLVCRFPTGAVQVISTEP